MDSGQASVDDIKNNVKDTTAQGKIVNDLNQQKKGEFFTNNPDMYKLKDQFSDYTKSKYGVSVDVQQGDSFDASTGKLTTKDGSVVDLNKLGHDVQSTATGVSVNNDLYQSAKNIHGNGDGSVNTDSASHVQAGGTAIDNAEDVTISSTGAIHVGTASVIQDGTTFVYDVHDYTNDGVSFSVGGAASVVSEDCLYFYNVTNATFNITREAGTIGTGNPFTMKDCIDIFSNVTPESNTTLTVNKYPAVYNISNATIRFGNESFTANNSALIWMEKGGISCINISPPGTYYRNYADIRKDFAIYAYRSPFRLCIGRGATTDNFLASDNHGLIDLVNDTIYINGEAECMRYPFRDSITSFDLMSVYDGHSPKARAILKMVGLYVDRLYLDDSQASDDIAVINPAEYITIAENSTSSFFRFSDKQNSYNIIRNYSTSLYPTSSSITDDILRRGTFWVMPESAPYLHNLVKRLEARV